MISSLLLFLLPSAGVLAHVPAPTIDDDVRARVDRVIVEWRAQPERRDGELTSNLVAIGAPAEEYLVVLLRRKGADELAAPIATALGRTGVRLKSVDALVPLLDRRSERDRVAGVVALGALGFPTAAPALVAVLDDPERSVRVASVSAIRALLVESPKLDIVWELDEAIDAMQHKTQAATLLGHIGSDAARDVLRRIMHTRGDEVAVLAGLAGFWLSADESDAHEILDILHSSGSLAVRRKACLVLGKIAYRPATRDLIDLLHSEEKGLASDAHWALRSITGLQLTAVPALWESWWKRVGRLRKDTNE